MKPRTRRAVVAALTALALSGLALSAASCAAGSGPAPSAPPPLGAVPVVHTAADIVLPLDSYRYTTQDYVTRMRAQARLTADCMRRFGVDYSADPGGLIPGINIPVFEHLNDRRYGLIDPASAAVRGYRPADQPDPADLQDQQAKRAAAPDSSPQTLLLLYGHNQAEFAHATLPVDVNGKALPADGCTGEAEHTLAGGVPGNLALAESLAGEAFHRAQNDARLRPVMRAWSTCMSARGYQYADIWQPNDKHWPDPVGPEEIATATADVACKLQTNLAGMWLALETAYQHQEIEQHAQQLAQLRRYLDNLARNSARLVDG